MTMIPQWLQQVAEAFPDADLSYFDRYHNTDDSNTLAVIVHGRIRLRVWHAGNAWRFSTSTGMAETERAKCFDEDRFSELAIRAIEEARRCTP